ncbi:hypothetical protein ACIRQP_30660 [Streptomyces sp. NPDC102274]|uniref:hypothetical protein n=1 Tax=Streptomyces sp. NPDC102274 TaxID=3366151 RepID=UPI0038291521
MPRTARPLTTPPRPTAAFARPSRLRDDTADLVSTPADCSSDFERDVLRLLTSHGIRTLSQRQLAEPVDLALPDIERPTIRHAPFFPEDP